MTEMSVREDIRRPPSSFVEDDGVGGMQEDDTSVMPTSRLREDPSETRADVSSGLDKPDASDRRETTATCIGRVIIRLEDFCRMNGINEVLTASLIGQIAMDMCQ